jgi:hypothetical protein
MGCEFGRAECPATEQRPRHRHVCDDLNQIGEACECGCPRWLIMFGGLTPARIQCEGCGAGFNLTERLRRALRDSNPIHRSNR